MVRATLHFAAADPDLRHLVDGALRS
jgi:hypothetical protein